MFKISMTLAWFENRQQSKKTAGARRSAKYSAAKAHAMLQRYRIPVIDTANADARCDVFSQIKIAANRYVGEEDGIIVRETVLESLIAVGAVDADINTNQFKLAA